MERPLRIFFFSDWRIQPLELVEELVRSVAPLDVIVYGGDDVARFVSSPEAPEGNWFARFAHYARFGVLGVIGNDCDPEDRLILTAPGVRDLHRDPVVLEDAGFLGIEGAIYSGGRNIRGHVLHHEREVRRHLRESLRRLGATPGHLIVVSHTPPAGCRLDIAIRWGFDHLGSEELRRFIDVHQPALVLCGHCHCRGGKAALLGNTLVVNAASDDTAPQLARACLIELGEPPTITWLTPPRGLIGPDIGPRRAAVLASHGITRLEEILAAPATVRKAISFGPKRSARLEAYLRARQDNAAVWMERPRSPIPERLLFYDVETGLSPRLGTPPEPWMIAVSDGTDTKQWMVPDENRKQRRVMYQEFLEYVLAHRDYTLCSWSGTRFDDRAIECGLDRWAPSKLILWNAVPKLDILSVLKQGVVLPLESWSLKDVAAWCGFSYTGDMDGFEVGLCYEEYRKFGDPLPVEAIARYNVEDVQAVAVVVARMRQSLRASSSYDRPNIGLPTAVAALP